MAIDFTSSASFGRNSTKSEKNIEISHLLSIGITICKHVNFIINMIRIQFLNQTGQRIPENRRLKTVTLIKTNRQGGADVLSSINILSEWLFPK